MSPSARLRPAPPARGADSKNSNEASASAASLLPPFLARMPIRFGAPSPHSTEARTRNSLPSSAGRRLVAVAPLRQAEPVPAQARFLALDRVVLRVGRDFAHAVERLALALLPGELVAELQVVVVVVVDDQAGLLVGHRGGEAIDAGRRDEVGVLRQRVVDQVEVLRLDALAVLVLLLLAVDAPALGRDRQRRGPSRTRRATGRGAPASSSARACRRSRRRRSGGSRPRRSSPRRPSGAWC